MKKILLSLLMLCSMTAAWAGEGTGTKDDPFRGEWFSRDLAKYLKAGDYLAYDCVIKYAYLWVTDTKIKEQIVNGPNDTYGVTWGVGDPIDDTPWDQYIDIYCGYNTLEERQSHIFLVTNVAYKETYSYQANITIEGYYSGYYSLGDGTEGDPYTGRWRASDLAKRIKAGDYLTYDCEIKEGEISVTDTQIGKEILSGAADWTVCDPVDETPWEPYAYYYLTNPQDKRVLQKFFIADVELSKENSSYINFRGCYTGNYSSTLAPTIDVSDYNGLLSAVKSNLSSDGKVSYAKIRLDGDIYLSDGPECTLNNTFGGIFDGNGHTIWAARPDVKHDGGGHYKRSYLFTYSDGAIFKNLKFKNIREESSDRDNQAIITTQAKNGCVFENITFDNISIWTNENNAGAVAGYATDCTFTDIKVINSDITVDGSFAGGVVGYVESCVFTNMEINNTEVTAHTQFAGGVTGRAGYPSEFNNIEIHEGYIEVSEAYVGGVVGILNDDVISLDDEINSLFTNCTIDDKTCVCAYKETYDNAYSGGIVGYTIAGLFTNCVSSAFVSGYGSKVGGLAGHVSKPNGRFGTFVDCLNTGMVVSIKLSKVADLFRKYKNKELTCHTKLYKGKKYSIRTLSSSQIGDIASGSHVGGIAGHFVTARVSKCANLGSIYSEGDKIAGIAGSLERITEVKDCLSDFVCNSNGNIRGIVGDNTNDDNVMNCLTLTNLKATNTTSGKSSNNYTLKSGVDNAVEKSVKEGQLSSGKICHLLGEAWQQNLGVDALPEFGSKGLYHTRKVSNQYGTVCFPFAVKSDDKISYYTFNGVKGEGQDIKLVFKYVEENQPGFPVLFRAAEAKDAVEPVDINFSNAGDGFTLDPQVNFSDENWWLYGTFEQKVFEETNSFSLMSPEYVYYVSGGQIRNAKKTTIAPYRAWFHGPNIDTLTGNGTNQAKSIRFVVEDEDGETTEIKLADFNENQNFNFNGNFNGKTYSIMGTQVNENYRGIVIKNGKKMLKK